MNKILIGFILLVLMLPELQSQVVATGSVSGTVVDAKTGETLIGVIAVIDDNQALSASSDKAAQFIKR